MMRLQLVYLLITLTVVSCNSCDDQVEDKVSLFAKDYDLINDHLVKYVNSDKPEANMFEANKWLKNKQFWLVGGSVKKAIAQFSDLFRATTNERMCDERGIEILESNNKALNSAIRLQQENYPLQRIDRLIEKYHFRYALMCINWIRFSPAADLRYGFKQIAYEKINKFLEENGANGDIGLSMELIKNQLEVWEQENKVGALADAARQLVSLDSVLKQNKCTFKAYEILFKNELATKRRCPNKSVDLLKNLAEHYAREHAILCRDNYPNKFLSAIKQLNEKTIRSVLILTSEFYFQDDKFSNIANSLDHSYYVQLNTADFTTPEVVSLITRVAAETSDEFSLMKKLDINPYLTHNLVRQSLKLILTEINPNHGYLTGDHEDLGSRYKIQYRNKLRELYTEYLFEPCKRYKDLMDMEIFMPYEYDSSHIDQSASTSDELAKNFGFLLGRATSSLCGLILKNADRQVAELVVEIAALGN